MIVTPQTNFPVDAQIYRQSAYHIAPDYNSTKLEAQSGYSIPTTPDPAVLNQMLQNPYLLQTTLPPHLILNKPNEKLFLDPAQQANPARPQLHNLQQQMPWQHSQLQSNVLNTYHPPFSNNIQPNTTNNSRNQTTAPTTGNGNGNGQYDTPQGTAEYSHF